MMCGTKVVVLISTPIRVSVIVLMAAAYTHSLAKRELGWFAQAAEAVDIRSTFASATAPWTT